MVDCSEYEGPAGDACIRITWEAANQDGQTAMTLMSDRATRALLHFPSSIGRKKGRQRRQRKHEDAAKAEKG